MKIERDAEAHGGRTLDAPPMDTSHKLGTMVPGADRRAVGFSDVGMTKTIGGQKITGAPVMAKQRPVAGGYGGGRGSDAAARTHGSKDVGKKWNGFQHKHFYGSNFTGKPSPRTYFDNVRTHAHAGAAGHVPCTSHSHSEPPNTALLVQTTFFDERAAKQAAREGRAQQFLGGVKVRHQVRYASTGGV